MSKWLEILNEIESRQQQNLDEMTEDSTRAKTREVGFIHDETGAGILARNDGKLEGFADYGLGFRLDPERQSLSLFAPNVQIVCGSFNVVDIKNHQTQHWLSPEHREVLTYLRQKSPTSKR